MNETIVPATISDDEFFDSISDIEMTMTIIMMILMILIVGRRENRNINNKEGKNITMISINQMQIMT